MTMTMKNNLFLLLLAVVVPVSSVAAPPTPVPFLVIAHPDPALAALSLSRLSLIFLRRETRLPDGSPIRPVDQARSAEVRASFTLAVHHKSMEAVEELWQELLFAGRTVPPPVMQSERQIFDYVKTTPGALAYVVVQQIPDGIMVVSIVR